MIASKSQQELYTTLRRSGETSGTLAPDSFAATGECSPVAIAKYECVVVFVVGGDTDDMGTEVSLGPFRNSAIATTATATITATMAYAPIFRFRVRRRCRNSCRSVNP